MTPERWDAIKAAFEAILEASPENRPSFLVKLCGEDEDLKQQVSRLLAEHEKATATFLGEPLAHLRLLACSRRFGRKPVPGRPTARVGRNGRSL
jgi:hypothetical protein